MNSDGETMIRDLLTLPLRIGLCATRLGLRVADRLIDVAMQRPHEPAGSQGGWEEPTFRVDIAGVEPSAADEMPSAPPPAPEVNARLAGASRETLAAVTLYERVHRGRATVLATADRQLRLATAAAQRPS